MTAANCPSVASGSGRGDAVTGDSGLIAVAGRLPDGSGHGVRLIDARLPDIQSIILSVSDWRAIWPLIEAAAQTADGQHPAQLES